MKPIYSFLLLVLLFLLTGCVHRRPAKQTQSMQEYSYKIAIDGVECALCARNAMKQLKAIPSLHDLRFTAPEGNYEKGVFSFTMEKGKQLQLFELQHMLSQTHFGLLWVTGTFEGAINPGTTGRSLLFRIPSWPQPFIVRASDALMEEFFHTFIVERKKPIIAGTLRFDHHLRLYTFIPATK